MSLYPGDQTTIYATIKDKDGVKVDPSAHEINVYDPDGALKGGPYTNPVYDGPGEYHLIYDIPADGKVGTWKAVWKATIGTGNKTEIITFDVRKT